MKMNLKLNLKKVGIYSSVLIFIFMFLYFENNSIKITNIDVKLDKLPKSFEGLKIVQISDLHNKKFGKNQQRLMTKIKKAEPDIIVITGDIIDRKSSDIKPAIELTHELCKIAPVYYVPGNHEFTTDLFSSLEKELKEQGVTVLRNSRTTYERSGEKIDIVGVDDPTGSLEPYDDDKQAMSKELDKALKGSSQQSLKILLSHRPELIDVYSKYSIDLTFSGHAHGGQIRLPFIKGIIAPNQGFFPKYTAGEYKGRNSVLIVSRGLGNSIFPQRIFNRPEIIVAKLVSK